MQCLHLFSLHNDAELYRLYIFNKVELPNLELEEGNTALVVRVDAFYLSE